MSQQTWILAARRGASPQATAGWQDIVCAWPEVQVRSVGERRMQIEASAAAIENLRERFGSELLIEPVISHGFGRDADVM